jgi:hypothetical protein
MMVVAIVGAIAMIAEADDPPRTSTCSPPPAGHPATRPRPSRSSTASSARPVPHHHRPGRQGPYSRIRFTHIDGRTFQYRQEGNTLIQGVNGVESVLTRNLVYIAFTFPRSDYPRLVSVSMTMGKKTYLENIKELELTVQKIRVMND